MKASKNTMNDVLLSESKSATKITFDVKVSLKRMTLFHKEVR